MPIDARFVVCSILLIMLMLSAYLFVKNWVYPNTINSPFGLMVFAGVGGLVFTASIVLTYFLLKFILMFS